MGRLERQVNSSSVIPLPIPAKIKLHFVHVDDLAALVAELVDTRHSPGLVVGAARTPVAVSALVRALAEGKRRAPLIVPVPWQLAWAAMRAAEHLSLPLRFRADSLMSIVHPNPKTFDEETISAVELGIELRAFALGRA
jgi:nucleoside-diphosphate-sugar epimerase